MASTSNAFQMSVPMAIFLYNSKALDVRSILLLVKYYLPLVPNYKVIELIKFKSAVEITVFLLRGAFESHSVSRLHLWLETPIHCRFKLYKLYNFVITRQGQVIFYHYAPYSYIKNYTKKFAIGTWRVELHQAGLFRLSYEEW